jgi:hypothetical protein
MQLFKVASIRMDKFSDPRDMGTCQLKKHCGIVYASCVAENWLKKFTLLHFVCVHPGSYVTHKR